MSRLALGVGRLNHGSWPVTGFDIRIGILTVSDRSYRGEYQDLSGPAIRELVTERLGAIVELEAVVPDERLIIAGTLKVWSDEVGLDLVLTTGGTGFAPRDVTPEAFEEVWEKPIPGFGELFRMLSYEKIGTSTIQSRACAGVARGTFLFCLPGSPGACQDGWDGILRYQLDIRYRPCNLAELLPRLQEA